MSGLNCAGARGKVFRYGLFGGASVFAVLLFLAELGVRADEKTAYVANIAAVDDFRDMWVGPDLLPFTADDVPSAPSANFFSTLGGIWFDLDGDGIQDFDTDNDGVLDIGDEVGMPVSERSGASADIPYSIHAAGGNKRMNSSSYPQFGQFSVRSTGVRTHHAYNGSTFVNQDFTNVVPAPDGTNDADIQAWYDANRRREFRFGTREQQTRQGGSNAPVVVTYNSDRADQWPFNPGSKYLYRQKNNLMFRQSFPKTPGAWVPEDPSFDFDTDDDGIPDATSNWVFADPSDVEYGTLQHPQGSAVFNDLDNEDTGGQGAYQCQNDHTRPIRTETRGILIPVADIEGLEDGSVTDPFGWGGPDFDMANYLRTRLLPILEDPDLVTIGGGSNCATPGSNATAGMPTHVMVEQFQVNLSIFVNNASFGHYPGVDALPAQPRWLGLANRSNPGFDRGDWPFVNGFETSYNCQPMNAYLASYEINKVSVPGTTVTLGGDPASSTITGGQEWFDCMARGGDCATNVWVRSSQVFLIYNVPGFSPNVDLGSQNDFTVTPADDNPRNLWALDLFMRRGPNSERHIEDHSISLGRYIRFPLEGDRTVGTHPVTGVDIDDGVDNVDDFTLRGTPHNTTRGNPELRIAPRGWGIATGPTRSTDGCFTDLHRVLFTCREGSLELPPSGGWELTPDEKVIKRYRDSFDVNGSEISSVSFAYSGATDTVQKHVAIDTFYVAQELETEANARPRLQFLVETGVGDLREAWKNGDQSGHEHMLTPCWDPVTPATEPLLEDVQPAEGTRIPTQQMILKFVPPADGDSDQPASGDGSSITAPPGANEKAIVWAEIAEDGSTSINWGGTLNDRGVAINPTVSDLGRVATAVGDAELELYTRWVLFYDGTNAELWESIDGLPEGDYEKNNYNFLGGPGYFFLAGSSKPFTRGDVNADGSRNIADALTGLNHLFAGGPMVCRKAGDNNDDGAVNIADPVYLLNWLFASGPQPPAPFAGCGVDDVTPDDLTCLNYTPCGV